MYGLFAQTQHAHKYFGFACEIVSTKNFNNKYTFLEVQYCVLKGALVLQTNDKKINILMYFLQLPTFY